jgi:hypothetical protein
VKRQKPRLPNDAEPQRGSLDDPRFLKVRELLEEAGRYLKARDPFRASQLLQEAEGILRDLGIDVVPPPD